jgi:hypothetical protein
MTRAATELSADRVLTAQFAAEGHARGIGQALSLAIRLTERFAASRGNDAFGEQAIEWYTPFSQLGAFGVTGGFAWYQRVHLVDEVSIEDLVPSCEALE